MHSSQQILISTRSKSEKLLAGFKLWQLQCGPKEGSPRCSPLERPRKQGNRENIVNTELERTIRSTKQKLIWRLTGLLPNGDGDHWPMYCEHTKHVILLVRWKSHSYNLNTELPFKLSSEVRSLLESWLNQHCLPSVSSGVLSH